MSLSADTKHALRNSLGHQAGTEMINAIDGFSKALAVLASGDPAPERPAPKRLTEKEGGFFEPIVPAPPVVEAIAPTPPVIAPDAGPEHDASETDAPF